MTALSRQPSREDLRRELSDYQERYPSLAEDHLFVLWFLRAFVTDSEDEAAAALCGGPRDKDVDAVLIDEAAKIAFVVQGKYRRDLEAKNENRGDVIGFAQLTTGICKNDDAFASLTQDMAPEVIHKLEQVRNRVQRRGYALQMYYVTLGKCSSALQEEAHRVARSAGSAATFQLFDGKATMLLLADYLDGVAPPVPSLDLEIEAGSGVRTAGIFNRYDTKTDIESWAFSMTNLAVAELFQRAGIRLFARNVRGFLGSTEINRGMEETFTKEPEYFFHYNNGITIVCDDAKHESSRGRDVLRVTNPQVINGQQTTRTLARIARRRPEASVLVRVIRVPRDGSGSDGRFEMLVSRIVSATNWQNAIRASDLMANDRRQIEIERQFRKLNYLYLRKRMTKGEARRGAGGRHFHLLTKEEIAQSVAGCDLDPAIVRGGKERLFEERWYGEVFPTADPNYYLTRYWLQRNVGRAARGYPERAYAKWLVLNFVWSVLQPHCRRRAGAEAFRRACERDDSEILPPLLNAVDVAFKEALKFYRSKRGVGQTAIDVSTFFQRRNLHNDFVAWRQSEGGSSLRFQRAWTRFEKAFQRDSER